ncbi:hypothetical protein ACFO3I_05890 [Rheinheimera marina]|uniref:Uncharacterized protein n=1 Tax=Rheinheimera marina TaxID=1774958 RepID=A0ABV9JJZ2_9GAMM
MKDFEELLASPELRPFIPAIHELQQRLAGMENYHPELAFTLDGHYQTEEELFSALLSQSAFSADVTNECGYTWDVVVESFQVFAERSAEIKFCVGDCDADKICGISLWLIKLCNWVDTGLYSLVKH